MRKLICAGLAASVLGLGLLPGAALVQEVDMDGLAREQAEAACKGEDLPALFSAMAMSEAVTRDYLAETVRIVKPDGRADMAADAYGPLPIAMVDFSYVTRASYDAWDKYPQAALVYVEMTFNQSSDNRWRADWVELSGPMIEGGEAEEQPESTERTGYFLFFPTETCWELVEDHVDEQP